MKSRGIGAGIVVAVVLLASAGEAQADIDTLFVDTTSDAALTACAGAAGDCSLRGAFQNADDGDAATDTDSIYFDATIFDGIETVPNEKTVVMASSGLVTDENLNLYALNSSTHPSAGIDGPPGAIAINVQDGTFDMRGIALFGGYIGLQHSNTAEGLTLSNDWFGLKLDGTASGNDIGVYLAGPHVDIGGGNLLQNVFAANRLGLQMVGANAADIDVVGNMFGVKADGATVAANTGADIDVSGNLASQAPSGVLIGGVSNDTPECDGGCNVIAAAGAHGVDMSGSSAPGTFTSTAANVDVISNNIGLNAAATASTAANGAILVRVGAADNIEVGDNRMAGGTNAVNAGSGAQFLTARDNEIGVNADGTGVLDGTAGTTIAVNSGASATQSVVANNEIVEDAGVTAISMGGDGGAVSNNTIGLPDVPDSGGHVGVLTNGSNHVVSDNHVESTADDAIRLLDTSGSLIQGNDIGTAPGGYVNGSGIWFGKENATSVSNVIGGSDPATANVIGYSARPAILGTGDGNDRNVIAVNTGGEVNGFFVDLQGEPGSGNGVDGPNEGIEPPKYQVGPKLITGKSDHPGANVFVYRSGSTKGVFPYGIKKFLGTAPVDPSGEWQFNPPGKTIKRSWVITANQNDENGNGSEFGKGKSRRR